MGKSLIKALSIKPPKELQPFLEDFHLVGDETAEDYINLFVAIAMAAKPADTIDWLYTKDVADLTWDIRRERAIKAAIIESNRKAVILDLLKATMDDPVSVDRTCTASSAQRAKLCDGRSTPRRKRKSMRS